MEALIARQLAERTARLKLEWRWRHPELRQGRAGGAARAWPKPRRRPRRRRDPLFSLIAG